MSKLWAAIRLFYCAGQEILQADGINSDGTVTSWRWILGTQDYSGRDPVHADPWDFLIDVKVGGKTAWIVGDGGPYAYEMPNPYEFKGATWTPRFAGLFLFLPLLQRVQFDHLVSCADYPGSERIPATRAR